MWPALAMTGFGLSVATMIVTQRVRDTVDARRMARRGVGGTQDVALWGTAVSFLFLCAGLVCLFAWLWTR